MVELFQFNKQEWENLQILKGSVEYMESKNSSGNWSEAIKAEKELFSDFVARKRRVH